MAISDKQLAANRANAKKSTGPRTQKGKEVCLMNGFVHGLTGLATVMTDEDRVAQIEFLNPLIEDLNPIGPMETQLARGVALDQFRLNKIKTIEDNMLAWAELVPLDGEVNAEHPRVHHGLTQALAFFQNDRGFNNLSLYEQRITRNMHKNLKLLRELQAQRKAEDLLKAKAKPLTRTASTGNEENGFGFSSVLSDAQNPAPEVEEEANETPKSPPIDLKKAA